MAGHEATSGPGSLPRPSVHRPSLPTDPQALPAPPAEIWPIVDAGLAALEIELTSGSRSALDAQLRLMLAWNQHVNLTALRSPEQVGRGHLLDSLSAVGLLRRLARSAGRGRADAPEAPEAADRAGLRLLDIGSGAGYPGLPLAIVAPVRHAVLVDSVGKKAAFLAVAAEAARAAMAAHGESPPELASLAERAEDLAEEPEHRAAWDVVVARAVGTLAELAELGLPLLREGGHLVAWKREPEPAGLRDEINAARRLVQSVGGEHPFVVAPDRAGRAGLPDNRLVVVRKVRPTPDRYPRSPAERRRAALR